MKILFFARLFHPHIGGVEKHVLTLSKHLIQAGHSIVVITEKYDGSLPDHEEYEGINIYRISITNEKSKKWEIWNWIGQHRNLVQEADVVHCHDVFFWYLPFRFMYPFKKVFTTFHGYESYPIKSSAIRVRKLSEILSNGNICIGDFITKWYGTHPTYISYGATQIVKKPSVNDSKTALFYGRLDDQTGIETYIEGFKKIKKSIKDFELLVIGNGVYEEDVQKITKRIDFKENLSQEINSHNILFVSRYLSILEALAAQRLVIAVYDNPVKRDYLQMAPFAKFIEICETSDEVAEKVIYYLKNPDEKNRKIELGYQWATQQTWENLTSLYLKLWNT